MAVKNLPYEKFKECDLDALVENFITYSKAIELYNKLKKVHNIIK
jgi:hypothetical protein